MEDRVSGSRPRADSQVTVKTRPRVEPQLRRGQAAVERGPRDNRRRDSRLSNGRTESGLERDMSERQSDDDPHIAEKLSMGQVMAE